MDNRVFILDQWVGNLRIRIADEGIGHPQELWWNSATTDLYEDYVPTSTSLSLHVSLPHPSSLGSSCSTIELLSALVRGGGSFAVYIPIHAGTALQLSHIAAGELFGFMEAASAEPLGRLLGIHREILNRRHQQGDSQCLTSAAEQTPAALDSTGDPLAILLHFDSCKLAGASRKPESATEEVWRTWALIGAFPEPDGLLFNAELFIEIFTTTDGCEMTSTDQLQSAIHATR